MALKIVTVLDNFGEISNKKNSQADKQCNASHTVIVYKDQLT